MSEHKQPIGPEGSGGIEPAIVRAMPDLIRVAPGAIVSRTLMRTRGGNVTAFALDAGQSIAEHSAPFDALVQLIEGEMVVQLDGEDHGLRQGDLILMPAGVPHGLRAGTPTTFLLTMLREPAPSTQGEACEQAGRHSGPADER